MKTFLARLLLSAALLLGLVSARAQSLYVRKELFQEGASASGTSLAAGLNNRGEVFYLYSPANSPPGSSIPGYWLPQPNYGLPAGFSPLTNFQALARSRLPWFSDDGTFYTLVTNADQGNTVYRGSAAGESQLCSQLTYDPLPTLSVTGYGGVRLLLPPAHVCRGWRNGLGSAIWPSERPKHPRSPPVDVATFHFCSG